MRIFITGGTGLLGRDIVLELSKNHELFVLARDDSKKRILANLSNVNFVMGTLENLEKVAEKIATCDVIVHSAGTAKPDRSMEVNYHLTEKLIGLCGREQKFIYISSFNASFGSGSNYTVSKQMAEKAVAESGMDYLIFRPTLLYNEKGEVYMLKLIRKIIKLPFAPQIGNGEYFLQPLFTKDLAKIISISLGNINNRVISVAGKDAITTKELTRLIMQNTKNKPILPIPISLLKFFGKFVGLNRDKIKELSETKTMDIFGIEKEFGISLQSIKEMMPQIIKYAKTT